MKDIWRVRPGDLTDEQLVEMIWDVRDAERKLEDYRRELIAEQARRHGINQMTMAY